MVEKGQELVKLNVGGQRFVTTRTTLCRVSGSKLEALFSGRHVNSSLQDEEGAYFMDRDGTLFQYVLDYLRTGLVLSLPRNECDLERLAIEADYYGLEALWQAIQAPAVDLISNLDEEMAGIWQKEEELRVSFHANKASGLGPHQDLLPLFGLVTLPILYSRPNKTEKASIVMDFCSARPDALKPGQVVSVKTMDQFQFNFNRVHANVLHRLHDILLDEKVIIAGGSVLQALTVGDGMRPSVWWDGMNDVDIFLYVETAEEATRISRRIFVALAVDGENWQIIRTSGVITMLRTDLSDWDDWKVEQKIQIILRLYHSPTEVLVHFDCDSCCCCYDGREVWVAPRGLRALKTGINTLNPLHAYPQKASYELRLAKYAHRGFAVALPGFDKKRLDDDTISNLPFEDLKGLARLLKVSSISLDTLRALSVARKTYDDETNGTIVPQIQGMKWTRANGYSTVWNGWDGNTDMYQAANTEIRNTLWTDIEDATGTAAAVEGVPDRLLDAWQLTGKQSREYLNTQSMDKASWDKLYYEHAYKKLG